MPGGPRPRIPGGRAEGRRNAGLIGKWKGGLCMIQLTKRNHEKFLVNHLQIEHIECIPESKITMMNHDYYLVRESVEEIIHKIAVYNAKVQDIHREIVVTDKR